MKSEHAAPIVSASTPTLESLEYRLLMSNVAPVIGALSDSPDPINRGSALTLTATDVSDSDGSIVKVVFYHDANGNHTLDLGVDDLVGEDANGVDGYSVNSQTDNCDLGVNTYFAFAIDDLGDSSAVVSTSSTVLSSAPTIDSLTPSDDTVSRSAALTLTANDAEDVDGNVARVQFYRDSNGNGVLDPFSDTLLGTDTNGSNGWAWTGTTTTFSVGENTFFARARDNDGVYGAPVSTTVTITNTLAVANNDAGATDEDAALNVNAGNGVLSNDTDANSDALTAVLVDGPSNAAAFTLNPNGSYSYTPAANFNGQDTFTYRINDGTGNGNTATVTITVAAKPDAPVANDATFSIAENVAGGAEVGKYTATDADADATWSYAITAGNDDGVFAIDADTGIIAIADNSTINFEQTTSYTLTVTVTDDTALTDTAAVTVNVTNINEAPLANDDTFTVSEAAANGAAVGTVIATDVDAGDVRHYAITAGNDDGVFEIDELTGAITVADASGLDFETVPSYTLTVTATDDGALADTATITVNVTDANDAPVATDATFTIAENAQDDAAVGVPVVATDADADATWTYAITAGNDDGVFKIDAATGAITIADASGLDFETVPSYTLTVTVTDNGPDGGLTDTATVTVNVTDVNEAPVANDATFSIAENVAGGAEVGKYTATDADAGATWSYAITAGNDDGVFAIDADTGIITIADNSTIDFESTTSYTLTITVTDDTALTDTAAVTVNVTNFNEAPVANDDTFTVSEAAANGAAVGTVIATDVDAGDVRHYAITAGNDDGVFEIDELTGAITVADASGLDFETVPSYTLTVTATDDGALADTATITVNVTDANDAPVANDATFTIAENVAGGVEVGKYMATDADAGATWSYAITAGNDDGVFAIDADTGIITIADNSTIDFESTTSYALTVTVTDDTALTDTAAVTVNVTNINEAPTVTGGVFAFAENVADDFVVGSVTGSDVDANDTIGYAITAGDDNGVFAIDANGQITVKKASLLDFETVPSYTLTVTVTDALGLTNTSTVTVNVTDANDAPVATDATFTIAENAQLDNAVGTPIVVTDADADATWSYAITAGNDDGVFKIDAATGAISIADASGLDFETVPSYTLTVTVTDNGPDGGLTDTATVTVNVTDANDAPVANDATLSIAENVEKDAVVGTYTATDVDAGHTLSYAITAGNDDGIFAIDADTGVITVADKSTINFEHTTSYTLTVTVTDNGALTDTAAVTVNVTNVNEAPVVNDATFSVAENAAHGTAVGTVVATDVDAGDVRHYAITAGNDAGVFEIDALTGAITVADASSLDFETVSSYTLTVTATDNGELADTATITVNVTNVNEAPQITRPGGQAIQPNASVVFSAAHNNAITIADVDANAGLVQVVLSVAHGTLTLGGTNGLTIVAGANGSSTVTVSGTVADINTALNGLRYAPVADYQGTDTLSIAVDDQGNTGLGGAQTDQDSVAIRVNTLPTVGWLATWPVSVMRSQDLSLTAMELIDMDGTIASVAFYYDVDWDGQVSEGDVLLGTDASAAGDYTCTVNTLNYPTGTSKFLAVATDNEGGVGEATATIIEIAPYALTYTSGSMTVTLYDMTGPIDVLPQNVTVSFGSHNKVSITLKGTAAMDGLGIVVKGASSVSSISDKRKGALGQIAFIASDAPVASISLLGNVTGYNLNDQTLGGMAFDADVDGDSLDTDLTALYLGGGAVNGKITVAGSIGGDVIAQSGLTSLTTAGISNADIFLGAGNKPDLTLGMVTSVNLASNVAMDTVKATQWNGGTITAAAIKTLQITGSKTVQGDLTADITLTTTTTGKLTDMAKLTVAGSMTGSTLRSLGSIGAVTLGAMVNSNIFAGLKEGVTARPSDRQDFAEVADALLPSITSIKVASTNGPATKFTNSIVSAWSIGTVEINDLRKDTPNSNVAFGLASHSLKSYALKMNNVKTYTWPVRGGVVWPADNGSDFAIVHVL